MWHNQILLSGAGSPSSTRAANCFHRSLEQSSLLVCHNKFEGIWNGALSTVSLSPDSTIALTVINMNRKSCVEFETFYYKGKAYTDMQEVADLANVSVHTVRNYLKRRRSLNELGSHKKPEKLVNIKLKGKIYRNVDEVAKEYHCSTSMVRKYIKERDAGEPVEDIWLED